MYTSSQTERNELIPLEKKIAIVTGGSSGIGRAVAHSLSQAGCVVYEFSRREIPQEGVRHLGVDVTQEAQVNAAVAQVLQQQGRVDIVVNCAGFGISGAVEFTELAEAKSQFDVNFFGCVTVNRAVLPIMRRQNGGRIVQISSVAASAHIPFQTYYSASKAALESYTCALCNEVRPFHISVTAVALGDIATGFTQARKKSFAGDDVYGGRIAKSVAGMEHDEETGMSPAVVGARIAKIALKPKGKPLCTVGALYKFLNLLCKFLPCRLRNFIVYRLYAA